MSRTIASAAEAWKLLNGVFCVYKPSGDSAAYTRESIARNLCRDLNMMKVRPPRNFVRIEGSAEDGTLTVSNLPSFADNTLVVGPRYQPQDFRIAIAVPPSRITSGICVAGINDGCYLMKVLKEGRHLRTYELCGQFGYATDNFLASGRVLEKTTYDHIMWPIISGVLSSWQAAHQKLMFQFAGVDIQSQEAFELAAKGPIRPVSDSEPLIYNIKCTHFQLPDFTLEVQCINETEDYLLSLIHDLGIQLKSTAVCTKIRRSRFGNFDTSHALLRKHWTIEAILNNITQCKYLSSREMLTPTSQHFMEDKISIDFDVKAER